MALGIDPGPSSENGEVMPIAVVGIGFRGPKDATNVERFWRLISEGREAWSLVPKEKWNNEAFYHPDSSRNGTVGYSFTGFTVEHAEGLGSPMSKAAITLRTTSLASTHPFLT